MTDTQYDERTALIVTDVQNDFADPGGSQYVAGGEDGYSGFTVRDPTTGEQEGTGLEPLPRARGIERLVIGGMATDYCVKETVLDARRLGFAVVVLTDAVRAVDLEPGDGDRAVE